MKTLNALIFAAFVSTAMFPALTQAASTIFTDEASFLSAVSSPSLESFESLSATNTQSSASITSTLLSVLAGTDTVIGIFDDTNNDRHPTDGDNYLRVNTNSGSASTEVTFTFISPITSFGIKIIDFGDVNPGGSLLFTNDIGESYTVATGTFPSGGELFFGLTSSDPFNSVTFTNENLVDGTQYDEIYISPVTTVPVPSSIMLLASALVFVRKRAFSQSVES